MGENWKYNVAAAGWGLIVGVFIGGAISTKIAVDYYIPQSVRVGNFDNQDGEDVAIRHPRGRYSIFLRQEDGSFRELENVEQNKKSKLTKMVDEESSGTIKNVFRAFEK